MRGVRLNFDSKSSVPPVDCHTYAGAGYPSYQTFPNSVCSVISGGALSSLQLRSRPVPSSVRSPSALGAKATAWIGSPPGVSRVRGVRPDVPNDTGGAPFSVGVEGDGLQRIPAGGVEVQERPPGRPERHVQAALRVSGDESLVAS